MTRSRGIQRDRRIEVHKWLLYIVAHLSAHQPTTSGTIYTVYHDHARRGDVRRLSERMLQEYLRELAHDGWIIRRMVYNGKRGMTCEYTLPPNRAWSPTRPNIEEPDPLA